MASDSPKSKFRIINTKEIDTEARKKRRCWRETEKSPPVVWDAACRLRHNEMIRS